MTVFEITSVLILFGAILMLSSIFRFRSIVKRARKLLLHDNKKISFLSKNHQVLMVFFLVGYLVVGYSMYREIQIISALFIGVIFFFGAVFVLLGISLQSQMLFSIDMQHKKLIKTNRQLLCFLLVQFYQYGVHRFLVCLVNQN